MSKTQEQEVFKAIPADYTIESVDFTASKLYANQMSREHSVFPAIVFNYPISGAKSEIGDISGGIRYYLTTLTLHILSKHYDDRSDSGKYVNGALIAKGIAQGIIDAVSLWELSPITGGVMIINKMRDIKPLENKGLFPDQGGVFDYVLSIDLAHT